MSRPPSAVPVGMDDVVERFACEIGKIVYLRVVKSVDAFTKFSSESVEQFAGRKEEQLKTAQPAADSAAEWARSLCRTKAEIGKPRVLRATSLYRDRFVIPEGGMYVVPEIFIRNGKGRAKIRVYSDRDVIGDVHRKAPTLGFGEVWIPDSEIAQLPPDLLSLFQHHVERLRVPVDAAIAEARAAAPGLVRAARAERADEDGDRLQEKLSEALVGNPMKDFPAEVILILLTVPSEQIQRILDVSKGNRVLASGATIDVCERSRLLAIAAEVMKA